jgi:hypothetical protein
MPGPKRVAMRTAKSLCPVRGFSFEVADLLSVVNWAETHGFRILVGLDHGAPEEEYEEVIYFFKETSVLCQVILWRSADAVVVQPLVGRQRQYNTVAEALDSLFAKQRLVTTGMRRKQRPLLQDPSGNDPSS